MVRPGPKVISAILTMICVVSLIIQPPVAADPFGPQVSKKKPARKAPRFRRRSNVGMRTPPVLESYPPRVVVKFQDNVLLAYTDHVERQSKFRESPELNLFWEQLQKRFPGVSLMRAFTSVSPEAIKQLEERARKPSYQPPNFLTYFYVSAPQSVDLNLLARSLRAWPMVQTAYVYRPAPIYLPERITPAFDCTQPVAQNHLDAAPVGIDAAYAQTRPGGDGAGVRFADIERGWFEGHEALAAHQSTLLCDTNDSSNVSNQKHGTSVLGVIYASRNRAGCLGIVPNIADPVVLVPHNKISEADAILCATLNLTSGDVILVEAQVFGPKGLRAPVEINDLELKAIRHASELGFVVVEAGGNGDNDGVGFELDKYFDPLDPHKKRTLYRHKANPHFIDSGAILVSAAVSDESHLRLGYAPHGNRIDCYAWGENIGTSSSILQGTINCYRPEFGGTSGASAIVAGAALAVQGAAQACLKRRLKPSELREILSNPELNTSPSLPGENIGVMPNLKNIIDNLCPRP